MTFSLDNDVLETSKRRAMFYNILSQNFIVKSLDVIGLLNCPITNCPITNYPITNCPITTWQANKWKIGLFKTNHKRGNCNFYDYS